MSVHQNLQRNDAAGRSPQRIVNVEFSGVKSACFPSRLGLLIGTQDGSQGRAISVADAPSCSMFARFAATRLTAFAQDALNIRCPHLC